MREPVAEEMRSFSNNERDGTDTFHARSAIESDFDQSWAEEADEAVLRSADRWAIIERSRRTQNEIDQMLHELVDQNPDSAKSLMALVPDKPVNRSRDDFFLESSWEGVVLDVGSDVFTARVTLLDEGDTEYLITLPLEDLDDADRSRIESGSLFYWNVGRDLSRRPRRRVSEVWLRRIDIGSIPPADSETVESFRRLFAEG